MLLDELVENILLYTDMLIEIAEAQSSVVSMGKLCNDISEYYRALGVCGLLINAETDVFFHGLIQAALTRKYYLNRCVEENHLIDSARRASFVGPFLDAVAANRFNLASEIASLSPDQWSDGSEYEDDFAYAHFLHKIISFNESNNDDLQETLNQFERALEGGGDSRLSICKALLYRDQYQFDESFSNLLNDHELHTSDIADPKLDSILSLEYTFEPNRRIFVEGLAILRIAEKVGLSTEEEYNFCPDIARLSNFRPFVPDAFPYLDCYE